MLDQTKKDKILHASLEEFAEKGFEKASTDSISKNAGVSKGLIFHYFHTKENLYMTTVNKCIDDALEEFANIEIPGTDFISKLMKMMELKYDFYVKNPLQYKLILNGFHNSPKKLKGKLQQKYCEIKGIGLKIMIDMIGTLPLKKDISLDEVTVLIAAITDAVEKRHISFFGNDTASFEKYYDSLKNEYIRLMNIVMYGIIDSERGESYE